MGQKFLFVYHILIYNIIKPLPCSSNYFNQHFHLSTQNLSDCYSHYKEIVKFGKEHAGLIGIILANVALMFLCLPICFSADLVIHSVHILPVKITVNAILVLIMLEKFDILRFHDGQNWIKLLYLLSSLVSSSYWTLTCLFLAAFENLV